MFILDLYKWCESRESFNRQEFARFIYSHRESQRLASNAGVTQRYFASSVSKEFLARMMTLKYIDGVSGKYWSLGSIRRPFNFELYSLEGEKNDYVKEIMSIGSMSDEELFCKSTVNRSYFERVFGNGN